MPQTLDRKLVKQLSGKAVAELKSLGHLVAAKQDIEEVAPLPYLSALKKLDLSSNHIQGLGGITDCTGLKQLNISSNQLLQLQLLSSLSNLQVLNIGNNKLSGKLHLQGLPSLGALIANNNTYTALESLGDASALNTLVLKRNRIASLGTALTSCTALAKLSIAHNQLADLGTSLSHCCNLAELRVSHNQLTKLPEELALNTRLKIAELGGNPITKLQAVKVLGRLPHLVRLSLQGCPVSQDAGYQAAVQAMLPFLQILDGNRLASSARRSNAGGPTKEIVVQEQRDLAETKAAKKRGHSAAPEGAPQPQSKKSWMTEQGDAVEGKRIVKQASEKGPSKTRRFGQDSKAGIEQPCIGPRTTATTSVPGEAKKKLVADADELQEAAVLKHKQAKKEKKERQLKQNILVISPPSGNAAQGDAGLAEPEKAVRMAKKRRKERAQGSKARLPAFLSEVISGRLESDPPAASAAMDLSEENVGRPQAEFKSQDQPGLREAVILRPGMHGARVGEALKLGLFDGDDDLGGEGLPTWA